MDRISESQFAELTGIDRRKCHTLLKRLVSKNILKRTATHKEGRKDVSYGFQKDFDKWKLPPIKRAATHKEGTLPPIWVAKLPPIKAHTKDTLKDTSTKEKEHTALKNAVDENAVDFYLTKTKKKLMGKRLETFMQFWNAFDYKKGKAEAADAWLNIPELTDKIVNKIIESAKIETRNRSELIQQGQIPKMAQGWLSGRRWEDEIKQDKKNQGYPDLINQKSLKEMVS